MSVDRVFASIQLPKDQVYLTTIQNIVKRHIAKAHPPSSSGRPVTPNQDKSECNWDEGKVDSVLFDTVRDLLMKVSHCDMAVACASWVVKELPMGKIACHLKMNFRLQ